MNIKRMTALLVLCLCLLCAGARGELPAGTPPVDADDTELFEEDASVEEYGADPLTESEKVREQPPLGQNLLINPGIADEDGFIDGWFFSVFEDLADYSPALDSAGEPCMRISSVLDDAACWMQTVDVEPGTMYRFRAQFLTEEPVTGGMGVYIAIEDTDCYSESLFDTNGEWVEVSLYGIAGDGTTELTVCAGMGSTFGESSGSVLIKGLEFCEVSDVPEDVLLCFWRPEQYDDELLFDDDFLFDEPVQETKADPAQENLVLLFAAAALFIVLAACTARVRSREPFAAGGILAVAAALFLRIVLACLMRGYETDLNCFLSWSNTAYRDGLRGFYQKVNFCDYAPGYILILWFVGALRALLGCTGTGAGAVLLVKLPAIVTDCAACFVLWKYARRRTGDRKAAMIALLYACNPAIILDSAGWGQTDGVLALAVLLAFLLAADKKWFFAIVTLGIGVALKPQALLFAPLGACVLVIEWLRSKDRRRTGAQMLTGFALACLLLVLTALPFDSRAVTFLVDLYTGTLGSYSLYSVNASNLWELLGLGWVDITEAAAWIPGVLAYVLPTAGAALLYARSRKRSCLPLLAGVMMACMFFLALKMHERYLLPAVVLLCAARVRNKRAGLTLVFVTTGLLLNMGIVLIYGYTLYTPRWLNCTADLINCAGCAFGVWAALRPLSEKSGESDTRHVRRHRIPEPDEDYHLHLARSERLVMLVVTVVYCVFTFVNLGSLRAPQTAWQSTYAGEQLEFDLGEVRTGRLTYYGGICDCTFEVEFSEDGVSYSDGALAQYNEGEIFRWLWYRPGEYTAKGEFRPFDADYPTYTCRYIRLTMCEPDMILHEIAFIGTDGVPYPIAALTPGTEALMDEQSTVPDRPSYYNGTYFDEIYHVRTAYEHLHGLHAYEWTHPPLGKLLIAAGIAIFGMVPFGWRFMGALFGVAMVPMMYLLIRQLSRSKGAAAFGMLLLALDCMHFTQSRIGTIDTFAVFFIMVMYFWMFRYTRMSFYREPLKKTILPLGVCGLAFALGCASKWIGIYAGFGLAVLFFWTLIRRAVEANRDAGLHKAFPRCAVITILCCCVFFIALPLTVYYFSYYPHLAPDGNFSVSAVWDVQRSIYSYHAGLTGDTHYFRSPWYEWPLIVKPMWYYSGNAFVRQGWISSISCMGNPAVWWGSLIGFLYIIVRWVRRRGADRTAACVMIGFASQFVPWMFVYRSTFIYHYFASVPFIILAAALMTEDIERRDAQSARIVRGVWVGASALLCAMFYPIMSGLPVPRRYAKYLRWFDWYNY